MVGDVRVTQGVVRFVGDRGGVPPEPTGRVGAGVLVVPRAAAAHQPKHDGVGAFDADCVSDRLDRPALGGHGQARLEPGDALVHPARQRQDSSVRRFGGRVGVQRIHARRERHRARRIRLDAHHDRPTRRRRERLTGPSHAAGHVRHARQRLLEVEFARVVRYILVTEVEPQVADRLIRHLTQRHAHELARREIVRLALLAFAQQPSNLRQMVGRAFVRVVVGAARPDGVLVELHAFRRRATEHHRPKSAAADRKRLDPLVSGRVVSQRKVQRDLLVSSAPA